MVEQTSVKSPQSPSPDLLDPTNNLDTFPPLTETPAAMSPMPDHHGSSASVGDKNSAAPNTTADGGDDESSWSTEADEDIERRDQDSDSQESTRNMLYEAFFGRSSKARSVKRDDQLAIYKSSLVPRDLECCAKLEDVCFPENVTNASKIKYRLAKGSGLNIGLFTSVNPDDEFSSLATYPISYSAQGGTERRAVMVAYLLATLTDNGALTLDDDHIPPDWKVAAPQVAPHLGHKPFGETVAIHSFGVTPELRGKGLGNILLKSYVQMIKAAKVYRSISLSAPAHLVSWFEKHDFELVGSSQLNSSDGSERQDMTIVFNEDDSDEDDG